MNRRSFFESIGAAFAQGAGLPKTGKNLPQAELRCPVCRKGDQADIGLVVSTPQPASSYDPPMPGTRMNLHQSWCAHCGALWARMKWVEPAGRSR